MADELTIARPYARAAFEFAKSNNVVENWINYLLSLSLVVKQSNIVTNAEIMSNKDCGDFIKNVLDNNSDAFFINFTKILVENKRLCFIDTIYDIFLSLVKNDNNELLATVTSSETLSESDKKKIENWLVKKYDKKIIVKNEVDQSLIAGLIVKVNDEVYDSSIKGRLEKLSVALQS